MTPLDLPDTINSEEQLDEIMSCGSPELIRLMKAITGDIILLGCAGKIGVQLAMAAVKAIAKAGKKNKVIGVSRFSEDVRRDGRVRSGAGRLHLAEWGARADIPLSGTRVRHRVQQVQPSLYHL